MHTNDEWVPSPAAIKQSALYVLMQQKGFSDIEQLHAWSAENPAIFWAETMHAIGIKLRKPFDKVLDTTDGISKARWLVGAELNIAESCFNQPPDSTAIVTRRSNGRIEVMSAIELDRLSNRVANGLTDMGLRKGDAIAMDMSMTAEAVAIYIGAIKAGCPVISIAESLPTEEILKRLTIGSAKAVFTQHEIIRGEKHFPLYDKVCKASAPQTIVLDVESTSNQRLRNGDLLWDHFLSDNEEFNAVTCSPQDPITILFSSGTTGEPKAIPWDHTTPIKCASDARYHHDVKAGDVLCWPTSMGWMMGPWLVFAGLLNRATIALYEGGPIERPFCTFVQDAKVTMLGVVPSIVRGWRTTGCAAGLNWNSIRAYSSSGEASNPQDSSWLMRLNQSAGELKPIIEYCGGTELAGGYLASNILTAQRPSEFNGKAMGINFVILNDNNQPCGEGEAGEVFLLPPSIGMSTHIMNFSNELVYYANCPQWQDTQLRRHGDRLVISGTNRWHSDGRADNTMNLAGIKVSSAEIERVVSTHSSLKECAAVGVPPKEGGADRLVIYVVLKTPLELISLRSQIQALIRTLLNPLFHIHDVIGLDALPRTASNKVMHRELRERYRFGIESGRDAQ